MIKSFIKDDPTEWDLDISYLRAAYRASAQESTGMTLNLVMFGREVRLPVDLIYKEVCDRYGTQNVVEYTEKLRKKLVKVHQIARKYLSKAYIKQKDSYNQRSLNQQFDIGDAVLILNEDWKQGEAKKLQPLYKGPALVVERLSDLNYKIRLDERGHLRVINVDKLKKYNGNNLTTWMVTARQQ